MNQRIGNKYKSALNRFFHGNATKEDLSLLDEFYDKISLENIKGELWDEDSQHVRDHVNLFYNELIEKNNHHIKSNKPINILKTLVAAASILIFISIGYFILTEKFKSPKLESIVNYPVKVDSFNQNQGIATLKIGSDTTISLTKENYEKNLNKLDNIFEIDSSGLLIQEEHPLNQSNVQRMTLSTAKGSQYHFILSDGTKVWLNASSTITFPSKFSKADRRVLMTGEVYFEVAHKSNHPFIVEVNNTLLKVLGTHFNVQAYPESKQTITTLIEGKVEVKSGVNSLILLPGIQASVKQDNSIKSKRVSVNQYIAWKDGLFNFEGENLQDVMQQISKWYDVEVHFIGEFPHKEFTGTMERSLSLKEVLEGLKAMNINVELKGRKMIIRK